MTDDKINQTIHEARGLCWHKPDPKYPDECLKCGEDILDEWNFAFATNPDYTRDWSAWGAALEWLQKQVWLEEFIEESIKTDYTDYELGKAVFSILNPECGSDALAEFIDKHPEHFTKEGKRNV